MTDVKRPCDLDTAEEYMEAFLAFDFEDKGFIDREDIR